jgi:predicted dehydrogenase
VSQDTLRFGILGAAKIAPDALIRPASRSEWADVVAVAARDAKRAQCFADEYGIGQVNGSYDELIQNPSINAVYNALPASLHAEWSIRALENGKHVLCEKPFAANAIEAEQMVATAKKTRLVLLEAFHYRYHPLVNRMLEIIGSGVLGDIHDVEGEFSVPIPDLDDIRYNLSLGGGATMDLGCYPIHWSRLVTGTEPTVLSAEAREEPSGIDVSMTADLGFPGDVRGRVQCSMAGNMEFRAFLRVNGSKGELLVRNPLVPHLGHALQVRTREDQRDEQVDGQTTYDHQLEAFATAVLNGARQPTGGRDAIANMRVIDAIYRAAGLHPRGAITSS